MTDTAQRQPHEYPRRILVAAIGMSPQVLTETLYCLAVKNDPPFVPNELHLITTAKGMNIIEKDVLDRESGKLASLLRDYALDQTMLAHIHVHVVTTDGKSLADIVKPEDNEQYANLTSRVLNHACADTNSSVHVSIAGGRKTMGYYLGYALSLFGREQDRLSHVLVQPEYENSREFFYPTPARKIISDKDGRNTLDAADAEVMLAMIPFVPMRDMLPETFKNQLNTFSDAIGAVLRSKAPATMRFDTEAGTLMVGEYPVKLPPSEYGTLAWIAWRKLLGLPDVSVNNGEVGALALAQEHARFHDGVILRAADDRSSLIKTYELDNDYQPLKENSGMKRDDITHNVTNINKRISEALGAHAVTLYGLQRDVIRGKSTTYNLNLARQYIAFEGLPEGWEI